MPLKYLPLSNTSGEIRLLTIHPAQDASPVKCSLANVSLGNYSRHVAEETTFLYRWSDGQVLYYNPDIEDTKAPGYEYVPSYEALSYCWGDRSATRLIEVNGEKFEVTANLFSALQHLRRPAKTKVLWVDAICINQNSIEERNSEVQRMVAVYQRAERTLVWLGDASEDSGLAMDLLEKLGGTEQELRGFKWPIMEWFGPLFDPFYGIGNPERARNEASVKYLGSLNLLSTEELSGADWLALSSLLTERAWWRRQWVIQEVSNAQSGETSRLEEILDRGPGIFLKQRQDTRHPFRSLGFEPEATLLQLLVKYHRFGCENPRDKIYTLMAIPHVEKDMVFRPDYGKSVCEVYCDLARALMDHQRDLTILCLWPSDPQQSRHGLPSWVPDWTCDSKSALLFDPNVPYEGYRASRQVTDQDPFYTSSYDREFSSIPKEEQSQLQKMGLIPLPGYRVFSRRSNGSGLKHGLIDGPAGASVGLSSTEMRTLSLEGIWCDAVGQLGDRTPEPTSGLDCWKRTIRHWEKLALSSKAEFPLAESTTRRKFVGCLLAGRIPVLESDKPAVDWDQVYYEQFLLWSNRISTTDIKYPELGSKVGDIGKFIQSLWRGWRFCLTARGFMGMVPANAMKGDPICVLFGAPVPLLLRPVKSDGEIQKRALAHWFHRIRTTSGNDGSKCQHFLRIGTAYMNGVMEGQVMEYLEDKVAKKQKFLLV